MGYRGVVEVDAIAARNGLTLVQCMPTENGASRVYVCQVAWTSLIFLIAN